MPDITIRERRISADYAVNKDGSLGRSKTTLVQYAVIADGRQVDSFMTRSRAEARAAELREKACA